MDHAAVYLRIEGRVQGVGYRYFAQEKAVALGLTGWVRNLPTGEVEALAHGPHDALLAWIKQLQRGPTMARVTQVHTEWRVPDADFHIFEIR